MRTLTILSGEREHSDPWHSLPDTSARLAEVLAESFGPVLDVRVVGTTEDVGAAIAGSDLVVINTSGDLAVAPAESRAIVDALETHSRGGGGVVALHCASLAFRDDPRWRELLGGRWVPGVTMHPQIGLALVQVTDLAGAVDPSSSDFLLYDERYTALETSEDVDVVAVHTEDGLRHPLVWCRAATDDRGPVAYDALGHGVESFDSPEHRSLIVSLVRWALDGASARALSSAVI